MSENAHRPGDSWATVERVSPHRWRAGCYWMDRRPSWWTWQYGSDRYAITRRGAERIARRMLKKYRRQRDVQTQRYEVT